MVSISIVFICLKLPIFRSPPVRSRTFIDKYQISDRRQKAKYEHFVELDETPLRDKRTSTIDKHVWGEGPRFSVRAEVRRKQGEADASGKTLISARRRERPTVLAGTFPVLVLVAASRGAWMRFGR